MTLGFLTGLHIEPFAIPVVLYNDWLDNPSNNFSLPLASNVEEVEGPTNVQDLEKCWMTPAAITQAVHTGSHWTPLASRSCKETVMDRQAAGPGRLTPRLSQRH